MFSCAILVMRDEVSVPIEGAKPGEVVVLLGHSLRNFSARAVGDNGDFKRGAKVVVVDTGANVVYVKAHAQKDTDASEILSQ